MVSLRRLLPSEDDIQIALVEWLRLQRDERRHAFHIPNEGKRSVVDHAQQERMGRVKGASDLMIPMARGGWNGLVFELKAHGKKPTPSQREFGLDMIGCGYLWDWADNLDQAMLAITAYADGRLLRPNWVHFACPAITP